MKKKSFRLFKHTLWKERPGVVSAGSAWCCAYGCYLHIHESLWSLLKEVVCEYRHDRHMVG
jgi:hypothetical protein